MRKKPYETENLREWSQGSSTVEAALVVSLTMMLLGTMIYLGMILHDRATAYLLGANFLEAAVETASGPCDTEGRFMAEELEKRGLLTAEEYVKDTDEAVLERRFRELFGERMLLTRLQEIEIQMSDREAALSYQGNASVKGGFFQRFLGRLGSVKYACSYERPVRPENFVRFCRGVVWKEE